MPKRRPADSLRKLGARIKARRQYLGRTLLLVASSCEISVNQLVMYETGQGHPPAFTLHRIARTLGTTSSALLGEIGMKHDLEAVDVMMRIHAHPIVGSVVRYMQDMKTEDMRSLNIIAGAFANRYKPLERVEVMR
jgi:transcriptional regulator with XRE-family HTH domain